MNIVNSRRGGREKAQRAPLDSVCLQPSGIASLSEPLLRSIFRRLHPRPSEDIPMGLISELSTEQNQIDGAMGLPANYPS